MPKEPKRKYVSAEINADEHRLLCRVATQWGQHPSNLVAIAVRRFLQTTSPDNKEKPLDLKVYQAMMEMRKSADIESYLRDMAIAYQQAPTEEGVDLLRTTAELAGYTIEEVLQWVEEDRLIPLGSNPSAIDVAVDFLSRTIESGQEYGSTAIIDAATTEGIAQNTLGAAKRKLNIRSERRPDCWVWIRE